MNSAIIAVMVLAVVSVPALGSPFDDAMKKCDAGPTTEYKQCVAAAYAQRDGRTLPKPQTPIPIQTQARPPVEDYPLSPEEQILAQSKAKAHQNAVCGYLNKPYTQEDYVKCLDQIKDYKGLPEKTKIIIGMTIQQVRDLGLVGLEHINTTRTADGERQQWVFRYGGYLYFTNGVLTAIQN